MILSLNNSPPPGTTQPVIQPTDPSIPVSCLRPGQSARIHRIVGRAEDVHRLEEFGLCQGAKIQMFRGGNPCILRMAGNKVCLRADDLLRVLVTPAPFPN